MERFDSTWRPDPRWCGTTRRRPGALLLLVLALVCAPGCLVLTLHPAYDDESIGWDPGLLGEWRDEEDRATLRIERGEWKSYRVHYVHPIEIGVLTGYVTAVGDTRYLDLMPVRGEDHGSFLIPAHVILKLRLDGDRLELTPLNYDWFIEQVRVRKALPGLDLTMDQKENALVVSRTEVVRNWLRLQPADGSTFSASAVFVRKPGAGGATGSPGRWR